MTTRGFPFIILAVIAGGCKDPSEGPTPRPSSSVSAAPSLASAQTMLDAMDTRKPVPLVPMMANHQKQNMRDHLAAVHEIVAAVATNDFTAIEKAASQIGFSEQMGMMCTHMGAGAPGFTEAALHFHHTADTISEAAKQKDLQAVLSALNATLATCTSCHATFKQQVVDDATWASMTNRTPPSGAMHQ